MLDNLEIGKSGILVKKLGSFRYSKVILTDLLNSRAEKMNFNPHYMRLLFLYVIIVFNSSSQGRSVTVALIYDTGITPHEVKIASKELGSFYNISIKTIDINEFRLPEKYQSDTINGKSLINYVEKSVALEYDKYLLITPKGVTLNDGGNYSVRGLSPLLGRFGIVSTLVIRHEFKDKILREDMFAKILIHELGHLFGLKHCTNSKRCVLVSSIPDKTFFYNADKALCDSCLTKIDGGLIKGVLE